MSLTASAVTAQQVQQTTSTRLGVVAPSWTVGWWFLSTFATWAFPFSLSPKPRQRCGPGEKSAEIKVKLCGCRTAAEERCERADREHGSGGRCPDNRRLTLETAHRASYQSLLAVLTYWSYQKAAGGTQDWTACRHDDCAAFLASPLGRLHGTVLWRGDGASDEEISGVQGLNGSLARRAPHRGGQESEQARSESQDEGRDLVRRWRFRAPSTAGQF